MPATDGPWLRDMDFPFPPFPGLGIRIDVYEMLNIAAVIFDEADGSLTCMVEPEGHDGSMGTASELEAYGFSKIASEARIKNAVSPIKVNIMVFAEGAQWSKDFDLPFPPFVGMCIRVGGERLLKIGDIAVSGEDNFDLIECYAGFEGVDSGGITEVECESLGFERDYR